MISDERLKKMVDPRSAFDFPDNFESKEMARELLERRQADRWIPVSERLPEDKQMCFVCLEDGVNPIVGRYIGGREFHDFFKNWIPVTRWRPLPTPPQEQP